MTCGCPPRWLTSVSVPVTAEAAVAHPCPCCGAGIGCRCVGGSAGWVDKAKGVAFVDVCPARLETQRTLL